MGENVRFAAIAAVFVVAGGILWVWISGDSTEPTDSRVETLEPDGKGGVPREPEPRLALAARDSGPVAVPNRNGPGRPVPVRLAA